MKHREAETECMQHELMQWLKKNICKSNKVEMLSFLAKTLPRTKPRTTMQRDIVENMLEIVTDAGHIAPLETLEAMSKSILWAGNEYIPHFARSILLLERPAIDVSPNRALMAIEESLMVCYSVILPMKLHGIGRYNDKCILWQRYTFSSIIQAFANRRHLIDPSMVESLLTLSEIMTGMTPELRDLHEQFKFLVHDRKPEDLAWH